MKDSANIQTADYPARAVTDREVTHFREFGWAKLERFVHPDLVGQLLDIARGKMGEGADDNPGYGLDQTYFNPEPGEGLSTALVSELIETLGFSAATLIGRPGVGARYYADFFAPKLPAVGGGTGRGPTAFHQDFITHAVDRSGGMTFWIPLEAYGPEAGTMSFINGSHRSGVLGHYHTYGDADARDIFPRLRDMSCCEPLSYAVGDVSVHDILTVHGAGPNLTQKPRWAYLLVAHPEDARWTGAPPEAFDTAGMVVNQRLDDERFPVIGHSLQEAGEAP